VLYVGDDGGTITITPLPLGSPLLTFLRTRGPNSVTGLCISAATSEACGGLARVHISMSCRESPGHSLRTRPPRASPLHLTLTYCSS
jgi:hypothetical protein